jgi:hypothetical protein
VGLIGYWSFNEGTSTQAGDFSGSNQQGFLGGMANPATPISGWGSGWLGSGLNFDGTNDYVGVNAMPSTNALSQLTISGWVKRKPATPTRGGVFVKQTNVNNWLALQFFSVSQINVIVSNGSLAYGSINATAAEITGWHHYTMVFDGTQTGNANRLKLYIDGVSRTLSFPGASIPATTPTIAGAGFLGYDQQNNTFLNGSMDEVRMYNRALSATEVANLYQTGAQTLLVPNDTGLVGYWSFNEGTSTRAGDYSGYGRTIPLVGNYSWTSGKFSKAISITGSSVDRLDVTGVIPSDPDVFSFSACAKANSCVLAQALFTSDASG